MRRKNRKNQQKDQTLYQQNSAIREWLKNPELDDDLQDKILSSGLLAGEQEFTSIGFNQTLVREELANYVSVNAGNPVPNDQASLTIMVSDFQKSIFNVTPELAEELHTALEMCETRTRLIGKEVLAEIASVTKSLFEVANPITLVHHPLVINISIRTLERLLEQPGNRVLEHRPQIHKLLSEFANLIDNYSIQDFYDSFEEENLFSDDRKNELTEEFGDLPAKALYKNFGRLDILEKIEDKNTYILTGDHETYFKYKHADQPLCLTFTPDRVTLESESMETLNIAMEEIENVCGNSLFYLAKTVTLRE
ncbi:TPA: hypothetical protein EYO57_13745 [Candidatus Poribacteria bacterium]|nr:hypothetical protein [Candidatus Poribacteria bacterium]